MKLEGVSDCRGSRGGWSLYCTPLILVHLLLLYSTTSTLLLLTLVSMAHHHREKLFVLVVSLLVVPRAGETVVTHQKVRTRQLSFADR